MLKRRLRPGVAVAYVLGSVSGALLMTSGAYVVSGLLSPLPEHLLNTALVAMVALLLLRATGCCHFELPQRSYQIPRHVFKAAPRAAAFRFAFELGVGYRTYVTASAPYALAALALFAPLGSGLGALGLFACAGVGFGLGRSVIVSTMAVLPSVSLTPGQSVLNTIDLLACVVAFALSVRLVLS